MVDTRTMYRAHLTFRDISIGWAVILATWFLASHVVGVPRYLLAPPEVVVEYAASHRLLLSTAAAVTASEALCGTIAALVFGVATGTLLFYSDFVRKLTFPALIALQTTPIVALVPLISFWFGYGWLSNVVIATLVATLPVILASYRGLADAEQVHIHTFRVMGAKEAVIFWQVRFPSAIATLVPAVQTSLVFAIIGSVVADFMGGRGGIGFLIMTATYNLKPDVLMTAVILSAIIGQAFLSAFELLAPRIQGRLLGDDRYRQ